MEKRKYFILIETRENNSRTPITWSEYFDTEAEAMEWYSKLEYIKEEFEVRLSSEGYDEAYGDYNDIRTEKRIK